ncbi:dimethyl sulfoxide reductase anchor subunit [Vibrio sp. SS-MA-C1-2]|uniref:dimethyl sulfoxide reductase anchor subunit family protein n=1 Tax=Vibrio sp. SS-MA-C1-2 TaxID=2908646 RepID=UPI001F2A50F7|nr:DmsC/YnfH family molybdoenzyme membrane anchor subunit [Vibrio sp. SS-MA-C1-2]UJF18418.1 dimethyl sulfoxide reductase anchor subunit [Vibrio sp. SS-MA-C1-2]
MHELPLVFLTVLAQSAVGIALFATLALFIGKVNDKQYKTLTIIALVVMAFGGIASLFHLGQPLRAINALSRIGSSPMSNEIIMVIVFGSALFLTCVSTVLNKSASLVKLLGLITSIVGFALLLVIPSIYELSTIPQWNSPLTPIQMILTAFTVGPVVVYLVCKSRVFSLLTILGLLVGFIVLPTYLAHLANVDAALLINNIQLINAKVLLSALAILSLALQRKEVSLISLAAIFIIVAEFCGRIGFYDLWQIGM